jgi:hypothetical protein
LTGEGEGEGAMQLKIMLLNFLSLGGRGLRACLEFIEGGG